ncbi:MAG: DinB family protein [Candidatus Kariarchaeaceae archaeon]|jgi:hypothetical protein
MTKVSEIEAQLNKSMAEFEHVVSSLRSQDLDVQINEGDNGWSVVEILRHVQNSERGMTKNLRSIIDGGEGVPEDFDLVRYNAALNEKMKNVSLDEIMQNMQKYRENTLNLLRTMKDEDWDKTGRHPTLEVYTVEKLFEIIWSHPINHLKGIRENFSI